MEVDKFANEAAIKRPSNTPVFADAVWTDAWPQTNLTASTFNLSLGDGADAFGFGRLNIARHGSGASTATAPAANLPGAINLDFADGHAATVKLRDLRRLTWNANWTE
jgi:hypothetical protein